MKEPGGNFTSKRKLSKQQQTELIANEDRFHNLIEMLPGMVVESDLDGNIAYINKKGLEILGYTAEEIKEKNIWELLARPCLGKDKNRLKKLFLKGIKYPQEYYLIRKDQSLLPIEIHCSPIKDSKGKLIGFQGILLDITSRKKYEDKIKHLCFHDKLTGLYNRAYFEEELERLNNSRLLPISVIMGDVNNLKVINDTFGHQHGDQLLIKIADILRSTFRKSDVISRFGGDEFSIILPNTSYEKGVEIINRVKKACQKNSTLNLFLTISLGIATKEYASQNINTVLRDAEAEMYRFKTLNKATIERDIFASLERALRQKDVETEEYRHDLIECALKFGKFLKLKKKELEDLKLLATICDIGKIAVSEEIILKKGWLSEGEWCEIRKHPEIGFRIAKSAPKIAHLADAILYHHEFWDGNGYPHGLKGEKIPFLSRIIHVITAYQAMTHKRPYREAMTREDAIQELRNGLGSQFDPELTVMFIDMLAD
ncbi:MAG: diguanylate cyclase [Candidatus Atribacteria bacterium]|nr:diguanylate cyclase [Candidatus Atribacteria bacterium]